MMNAFQALKQVLDESGELRARAELAEKRADHAEKVLAPLRAEVADLRTKLRQTEKVAEEAQQAHVRQSAALDQMAARNKTLQRTLDDLRAKHKDGAGVGSVPSSHA